MQGDVDINIGDGTAVFDMAMHPNTSSNHTSAPLIVSMKNYMLKARMKI